MKTVGFLFLSTIAHIYHLAPIAFETSRKFQHKVKLFISTEQNYKILKEIETLYPNHKCEFIKLNPGLIRQFIESFQNRPHPKIASVLKANKKQLLNCDALLTPDKNLTELHRDCKRIGVKTICTNHGIGYGTYPFLPGYKMFDYIFVAGRPCFDKYLATGYFKSDQIKITGYPKFDLTSKRSKVKLFENNNPIIIYNPHDKSDGSSWYSWGEDILEFFYQQTKFNLIFAPHIQLFAKNHIQLPEKYYKAKHMLIDLKSKKCCDMTYTHSADLYLGDISSQSVEFLYTPRPCIFLNACQLNWKNNLDCLTWNLGTVIETLDINSFEKVIELAFENHNRYKLSQKSFIKSIFSIDNKTASQRAANALNQII